MSDTLVETMTVKNRIVEIHQDTDPHNPRENEHFGTMVCWHSRYNLGEKHGYDTPDDFRAEWNEDNAVILPLYLYDHSGITMSTGPFSCPWDSGQVGYIYASKEQITKEFGKGKMALEKAKKLLEAEVEEYDYYLTGQVYGIKVLEKVHCDSCEHDDMKELDACWGFIGDLKWVRKEAQRMGKDA